MRACIYGEHQADAYLHVPVGPYVRLIAEHLGDPGVVDGCTSTGLYLCHDHLNVWLDIADDDPIMEPTLLAFEPAGRVPPPHGTSDAEWATFVDAMTDTPNRYPVAHWTDEA